MSAPHLAHDRLAHDRLAHDQLAHDRFRVGRRVALAGLVAGCVPPPPPGPVRLVVGPPWQAEGAWFYPEDRLDLDETGLAVGFEPGRLGGVATNGERIEARAPLCAHRTLPLPSVVRVWCFDTGRVAVLRAVDRGPARAGRVLALTPGALGLLGAGQGTESLRVRVEVLPAESREAVASLEPAPAPVASASGVRVAQAALPPPPGMREAPGRTAPAGPRPVVPAPLGGPLLGVGSVFSFPRQGTALLVSPGAFATEGEAIRVLQRTGRGLPARLRRVAMGGPGAVRVEFGPVESVAAADVLQRRLLAEGWQAASILLGV